MALEDDILRYRRELDQRRAAHAAAEQQLAYVAQEAAGQGVTPQGAETVADALTRSLAEVDQELAEVDVLLTTAADGIRGILYGAAA